MGKEGWDYVCLKDRKAVEGLGRWWASLSENRGARARLRRAERPDDVLLTEPFFQFLQKMPADWSKPEHLPASAMVAAALAHVEKPDENQFARQLASPKKRGEKPRMSELRFQQLQKSRDPDEFFRRLLRAIRMLDGTANIYSLADNILHWMKEYRYGAEREPRKRLAVRWANEYYAASSITDNLP